MTYAPVEINCLRIVPLNRTIVRGFLRGKTNSVESEYVGHGEKTVLFVHEEASGRNGALRVTCARSGLVTDFDALTGTGKYDGMITYYIATSKRRKADGSVSALARVPLAT